MKDLKYNKEHPRPQLGSGVEIGDIPRTIDNDIPPLVERNDIPFKVKGGKIYSMGECTVHHRIASSEDAFPGHNLSVSHPKRYPTWDEVAEARYRLVPDDVYMVMPLPPSDEYLNIHPYMFNLHEIKYLIAVETVRDATGKSVGKQKVKRVFKHK